MCGVCSKFSLIIAIVLGIFFSQLWSSFPWKELKTRLLLHIKRWYSPQKFLRWTWNISINYCSCPIINSYINVIVLLHMAIFICITSYLNEITGKSFGWIPKCVWPKLFSSHHFLCCLAVYVSFPSNFYLFLSYLNCERS